MYTPSGGQCVLFLQLQEAESPELLQLDELFDIMEHSGCDLPVKVCTYCMVMRLCMCSLVHIQLFWVLIKGFLRVEVFFFDKN